MLAINCTIYIESLLSSLYVASNALRAAEYFVETTDQNHEEFGSAKPLMIQMA